jgi:hypothetical protein
MQLEPLECAEPIRNARPESKDAMLPLTDEELSRVQDLCRVLPPWKRDEFLQELARRIQGRKLGHADLRREAATAMRAVLGRGHAWVPEAG